MTPFHPKLRRALLQNKEHREKGLTAILLLEYERLVTQYYYLVHYPPERPQIPYDPKQKKKQGIHISDQQNPGNKVEPAKEALLEDIKKFRDEYMPNFDKIHTEWVENQKRALEYSYYNINPIKMLKTALGLLGSWFWMVLVERWFNPKKFPDRRNRD